MTATGRDHHQGSTAPVRLEHLDMLRGLAALLVVFSHARGAVIIDYSALPTHQFWEVPFYFATGLGGQAVMLFFALSGYLVGGPAFARIHAKRWDIRDYTVHRLSRLWTALIPALLMTGLIDWIGFRYLSLAGYRGEFRDLMSGGPLPGMSIDLGLTTLLGNIAFLMTVFVPVFGSNGALWSLAYEFAYYFTFPLAWLAVRGGVAWHWRIICAAIFLLFLFTYPLTVSGLGVIWIGGGLAYIARSRIAALSARSYLLATAISVLLVLITVPLTHRYGNVGNLAFGLAVATLLPCLARLPNRGGVYGKLSWALSEISFTLYVVHYPLVLFLWFWLAAPTQYPPGVAGLTIWSGLVAASIAYATAMWWLFERNTPAVRRWVQDRLLPRRG